MATLKGRAAILYNPDTTLQVHDVTFDPPKAGEVRVKIKATGLCHSDLYLLKSIDRGGNDLKAVYGPCIPGHGGAGIVESVGEGVSKVSPGDHVIILWMTQCNNCIVCNKKPMSNFCENIDSVSSLVRKDGTSRIKVISDGTPILTYLGTATFADYAILEKSNICNIPKSIPFEIAALTGCCLGTGYGSAMNIAKVAKGSVCAVWGLGAVGLSTIIGCKISGATQIYAIDKNPDKEKLALEVGATHFLNPANLADEDFLVTLKGQHGVDYAFECSGAPVCMSQAQKSLAIWGMLVVVGLQPPGVELKQPSESLLFGQTLTGGYYGQYKPLEGIRIICEAYENGQLENAKKLVTHRFPLEKINEGFDLLEKGQTIRTIIVPFRHKTRYLVFANF